MSNLEEKIRALPIEQQRGVEDFIAFLAERHRAGAHGTPALKWAGALREMASQYTSVELQHSLSDWRASGQ